jgi:hypothetical protein
MRALGFEHPEQLGALFIGGADYLRELTRDTPPLTDDRPKRVTAESRYPDALPPEYHAWRDVWAAEERFRKSPLIRRLWPESLRRDTQPWFFVQHLINLTGLKGVTDLDLAIPGIDRVLADTDLRAPVLWAVNSDPDLQRLIQVADPAKRNRPEAHYHEAAGLLADRRFDEAAAAFARAGAEPDHRRARDAFRLRIYSLCLAGRVEEARALAQERYSRVAAETDLSPFWVWMKGRFGLDPADSARLAATTAR